MSRERWIVGTALCWALLMGVGCRPAPVQVPPELIGVWRTDRVGYEENEMEFLDDIIIFRAAADHETMHVIRSLDVEPQPQQERTRYELVFAEQGEAFENVLYRDSYGALVFENRRGVEWRRVKADGS